MMEKIVTAGAVNILIVEDDEIDVEAIKRAFKKRNMSNSLVHASCGIDALEILRGENENHKILHPFIMLVDINMPRMNGIEFIKEVRKDKNLKKNVAFILTTSARNTDVEAAYELNAAGYFLKQDTDKLVDVVGYYRDFNKFAS